MTSIKPSTAVQEVKKKPNIGSASESPRKKTQFILKDLKLFKLFEEIKANEEKRGNKANQEQFENADSDSEDEGDNL